MAAAIERISFSTILSQHSFGLHYGYADACTWFCGQYIPMGADNGWVHRPVIAEGRKISSDFFSCGESWTLKFIYKSTESSVFQETFLSNWKQGLWEGIQRNLWICIWVCDAHPQDRTKWMIKLLPVSWEDEMVGRTSTHNHTPAPSQERQEALGESYPENYNLWC